MRRHSAHSTNAGSGALVKHSLLPLHRSRLTSTTFLRVLQPRLTCRRLSPTLLILRLTVSSLHFTAYMILWVWVHPLPHFVFQRADHIQCCLESLQTLDETCSRPLRHSSFLGWVDALELYSKVICAALLDHLQVSAFTRPPLQAMIPMVGDGHGLRGIGRSVSKYPLK